MKEIIRPQVNPPYALHDMNVVELVPGEDTLKLVTQSGMVKTTAPYGQVEGHVEWEGVDWDFSYAYLLEHTGNTGTFGGEKLFLRDFIDRTKNFGFSVMDETFGFNRTKLSGYLSWERRVFECVLEIYHTGDMVYVDRQEYSGMAEVILSHDSTPVLVRVPAEVAADLEHLCWDFAAQWVWHGPENYKFLHPAPSGQLVAIFDAGDFIDYLNRWLYPDVRSEVIREVPDADMDVHPAFDEKYPWVPRFNF